MLRVVLVCVLDSRAFTQCVFVSEEERKHFCRSLAWLHPKITKLRALDTPANFASDLTA